MKTRNGFAETDRVRAHTTPALNERIDEKTRQRLLYFAARRDGIPRRIEELDREWDVERWLETNASSLAMAGLFLGITVNRKWLWVPSIVLPFLLLHAVQGWCPPLPLMRRLGIRTQREIDEEKYALKFLRGDFGALKAAIEDAQRAIEAYRASIA
jgi:hypothetical protein